MSTANPTSTPKPTKKHQNQSKNGGKSKNESGSSSGAKSKSAEASADGASSSGGIFRPLVVLALPGVNLFRRFSQYKRLPQDPPKDKLEVELERLNSKIDNLLDKLDEVETEKAGSSDEECIVCESNKATMQTFPCTHQVVCRTCFVRTIQTTVAQRKLPLRCVLCRAKILRLKQHHKGQHGPHRRPLLQSSSSVVEEAVSGGGHGGGGGDGRVGGGVGVGGHGVPQSVSNYSITRLSQSSSNHSFASGVSSVSSGSSVSVRSTRSFNFDNFSNFQNVNLVHKNHLTRTTSGTSFSGRRRSRSPSPVGIGVRSRSMDGRMPKITVDRTPSDESLASSCAQMSMTSPGSHSSSSPRSPISPPWSSNGSSSGSGGNGGGARSPNTTSGNGAFFSGNGNGSATGSPNSPPGSCNGSNGIVATPAGTGTTGINNANNVHNVNQVEIMQQQQQQIIQTYQVSERRTSRLCTPLSPIKESRREGSGSSLELRCSPERSMTSSPVTPVDNENMASLIKWDDEEGDLKPTTPVRNQKTTPKPYHNGVATTSHGSSSLVASSGLVKPKPHPSSRIRCADKILNQLEIHADRVIATNGTASQNSAANANRNNLKQIATSLKNNHPTKRNAIIFGDIADRANANNMLTRNASLDESLDNMKQPLKPRKSVTFKDC